MSYTHKCLELKEVIAPGYSPPHTNPNSSAAQDGKNSADSSSGSPQRQKWTTNLRPVLEQPLPIQLQLVLPQEDRRKLHLQAATRQEKSLQCPHCRCFPEECDLPRRPGVLLFMTRLRCRVLMARGVQGAQGQRFILLQYYHVSCCLHTRPRHTVVIEKIH